MDRTYQLLDKAAKRHEIDLELARLLEHDEHRHRTGTAVITISRSMGSGGASIGKLVANELGFSYYDREIIEEVATQSGSQKHHIEQRETTFRDPVSSLVLNLLDSRHVSDTVYLRSLYRVLRRIEEQGRAVIIGRGGSCVLRSAVKIRIVAPFELRVQRIAQLRKLEQKAAEQYILQEDYAQRRFLKSFFGCDADDPMVYDLIINTEALSLEHGAELIITRLRQTWKEGT